MRKKILLTLAIFSLIGASLMAQVIEGGAGVIHINGDPNLDDDLIGVTSNEGNVLYDKTAQIVYFFDAAGTPYAGTPSVVPGTEWVAVDITALTSPITSIVVDAAGSPELTATTVGGVTTLSFESDATISFTAATNTLTFTDVDGDATNIDISGAVDFTNSNTINVTGTGTVADPYVLELDGADTAATGEVPTSDGAGGLTWGQVVQSATFTATGELELTLSDGVTKVLVNMESIPKVANVTELNAAAAAVDGTSGGIARAAVSNTFGLPATTDIGVLFFISN